MSDDGQGGRGPTKAQRRALADMAQGNTIWLDVVNDPPATIHGRTVPYLTFLVLERNGWIVEESKLGRSRWYRITDTGLAALARDGRAEEGAS